MISNYCADCEDLSHDSETGIVLCEKHAREFERPEPTLAEQPHEANGLGSDSDAVPSGVGDSSVGSAAVAEAAERQFPEHIVINWINKANNLEKQLAAVTAEKDAFAYRIDRLVETYAHNTALFRARTERAEAEREQLEVRIHQLEVAALDRNLANDELRTALAAVTVEKDAIVANWKAYTAHIEAERNVALAALRDVAIEELAPTEFRPRFIRCKLCGAGTVEAVLRHDDTCALHPLSEE